MATVEFTEDRRFRIIALLGLLLEGVPEQRVGLQKPVAPGFVHDTWAPTVCPECEGCDDHCPACRGRGSIEVRRHVDPMSQSEGSVVPQQMRGVRPYGLNEEARERRAGLDTAIRVAASEAERLWGIRPAGAADELAEANRHPYPWERTRARLRKLYDLEALRLALDALRDRDAAGSSLVWSVYVYSEPFELSTVVEQKLVEALEFISARMPEVIRAPGAERDEHPAAGRARQRLQRRSAA